MHIIFTSSQVSSKHRLDLVPGLGFAICPSPPMLPDFTFNTYRWAIHICNHLIYNQKLDDLSLFLIGSILGAAAGIIILVIMLVRIKDLPASQETSKYKKCVDCNCTPNECKLSSSSYACPNCTLNECCCWTKINTSN
jgi:hypothetical protein